MIIMTVAHTILEDSLERLVAKVDELAATHPLELQPIRAALAEINSNGVDAGSFQASLIKLAEAVIYVRKHPGSPSRLRDLPIPPYDLWLPFKARDLASSDPEDIADAIKIFKEFNHKVSVNAVHSVSIASGDEVVQLDGEKKNPASAGRRGA
jgi:hypothetical protein